VGDIALDDDDEGEVVAVAVSGVEGAEEEGEEDVKIVG